MSPYLQLGYALLKRQRKSAVARDGLRQEYVVLRLRAVGIRGEAAFASPNIGFRLIVVEVGELFYGYADNKGVLR